ncbi:hypothetical protein EDB83DRAFT_2480098 [Lactarius deliciosus]|nr:hypothetical protein EDB83DRAFT_2480098 [Lactarius deliciosus]
MSNEPASKATVASQEKLKGGPSFVNDLDPFFDGYSKMAQVEDERTTEDWNAVSQNHLIVSGLFAAVVATFLAPSFQNLKPDPQERSAFYLEKTYQLFAESHRTHDVPFFPSQSNPPASSPPKSAVWVNSLWSLSLVIILSSALLAVLVQQWRVDTSSSPSYSLQVVHVGERGSAHSLTKALRICIFDGPLLRCQPSYTHPLFSFWPASLYSRLATTIQFSRLWYRGLDPAPLYMYASHFCPSFDSTAPIILHSLPHSGSFIMAPSRRHGTASATPKAIIGDGFCIV